MQYYVYILESALDASFYVGVSQDPVKRLEKHNSLHKGYTSRKRPWRIVYQEAFEDKTTALKREKYIKAQKSRSYIIKLIESQSFD